MTLPGIPTIRARDRYASPCVPAPGFLYDLEALMKDESFTDRADTASAGRNHHIADIIGAKDRSYKPPVDKDEIRLPCLEPGDYGKIWGEFVHVHLDKSLVYEAFSYAWGPPYKNHKINLPNRILQITRSLFIALIRLRTSQTLVWLGEDKGNGHIVLNLLEKTGKTDTSSLQSRRISADWVRANDLPDLGDIACFALLKFWGRPLFRRTWVIQEFVLAKDALIICGDAQLNWKAFASAHEKIMQYGFMDWGTFDDWDI